MKRSGKILTAATGLIGFALLALVLHKIQQRSAEPFPGATVVLNSSEWRARARRHEFDSGYSWLEPQGIYYSQRLPHGFQVVRHQINTSESTKTALNPEQLPITITSNQWMRSLSPDGKTLLLRESIRGSRKHYTLVPIQGKTPSVTIDSWCDALLWSPDSRSLASTWWNNAVVLKRYDAQTGAQTETKLNVPKPQNSQYPQLTQITPEGKMLCFMASKPSMQKPSGCSWTLSEIQQDRVIEIAAPHIEDRTPTHGSTLSPTGERILWETLVTETSLVNKVTRLFHRKQNTDTLVKHWDVCDLDGKNWRSIGSAELSTREVGNPMPRPEWTPDGKGVHFVNDGKLCYLNLPK